MIRRGWSYSTIEVDGALLPGFDSPSLTSAIPGGLSSYLPGLFLMYYMKYKRTLYQAIRYG